MLTETQSLMTARELASRLGVSVRQVWRLRSAGQLPRPIKIGGSVRWDPRDIEAFIEAQKNCGGRDG